MTQEKISAYINTNTRYKNRLKDYDTTTRVSSAEDDTN